MIEYLLDKGYAPQFGTIDNIRTKKINWDRDCITFYWKRDWKRWEMKDGERIKIKPYESSRTFYVDDAHHVGLDINTQKGRGDNEFEDRFQLTHEYRGHKLKRFGV